MDRWQGKVAVVTGGSAGIGRALCLALASRGCHLATCDVNDKELANTQAQCLDAAKLNNKQIQVLTGCVDVSVREQVESFAEAVAKKFNDQVNYVFNNAGVAMGDKIEDCKYEDFEWIVGINLWGVIYGTRAFLPSLKRQPADQPAHIINISSIFGMMGVPRNGPYCTTKFAVRGFTETLRLELLDAEPRSVKVHCVHPGGIRTQIARNARQPAQMRLGEMEAKNLGLEKGALVSKEVAVNRFEQLLNTPPEVAAATMIRGIERGDFRILIGGDAWVVQMLVRLFPVMHPTILMYFQRGIRSPARAKGFALLSVIAFAVLVYLRWRRR